MAEEETLTLSMRVLHALRAARQIRDVADATSDVDNATALLGKTTKKAEQGTEIFGRSLGRANLGFISLAFSARSAAFVLVGLVAILPFIAIGFAAIAAAIALAIPGGFLLAGMMARFKAQSGVAGTAAHGLSVAFADVKDAFFRMVAPGSDIVFGALTKLMIGLRPILLALEPAMTAFATAVAQGIGALAAQLPSLVPTLIQLFTQGGPVLAALIPQIVPLVAALLNLAIQGLPYLVPIVSWLIQAAIAFAGFVGKVVAWTETDQGRAYIEGIGTAFTTAGSIITSVVNIIAGLADTLSGPLTWAAGAFLWEIQALDDALTWVADNLHMTWTEAFNALKDPINWVVDKITWLLGAADKLSGGVLGKITGAAGKLFGKAGDMMGLDSVGDAAASVAGATTATAPLASGIKNAFGTDPVTGITAGSTRALLASNVPAFQPPPLPSAPVRSAVPNRRPEAIHVEATLVTPDGEVLSRQTVKAARRRAATR